MTNGSMEQYIEKSLEEIKQGNVVDLVKKNLLVEAVFRELLVKLLTLLTQKQVLTSLEVKGIASEALDELVWAGGKQQEKYQKRLGEINLEIVLLNKLIASVEKLEEK